MFEWFWTIFSLGAPVDCRIRGSASAAIRRRLKTSRQIYKQLLALKEFSQSIFSFRKRLYSSNCSFIVYWERSFRGTQREILRKRPENNNRAWIKLSEANLSILGSFWEKIICSSLRARLVEEFPASKVHLQPATWLTGKFPSRRMSRHYWLLWVWP